MLETELKLRFLQPWHDALWWLPLWGDYSLGEVQRQQLGNIYYDTPDQALSRSGYALRIRQIDDRYIQTIKTDGRSEGGLHQRQEWEWPMPSAQPDLSLFAEAPIWAQWQQAGVAERLLPVFRTDFQRELALVELGDTQIEVAWDIGAIRVKQRSEPIAELELELKAGEVEGVLALGERLAAELPVAPFTENKAARGYALALAASQD